MVSDEQGVIPGFPGGNQWVDCAQVSHISVTAERETALMLFQSLSGKRLKTVYANKAMTSNRLSVIVASSA